MRNKFSLTVIFALFLILFLSTTTRVNAESEPTKGYSLGVKTYSIQSISFKKYEITSEHGLPEIVFAEYASETKAVYPAPKDKIPADAAGIVKKCQSALEGNIDRIINAQQENEAVRNYLSADNKIALFKKEDYLYLINSPREQTVQIEPSTGNVIAEFRSREIAINENSSFCLYITFIYSKDGVNKIIISAIRLKSVPGIYKFDSVKGH